MNLDAAWRPGLHAREVVDNECDVAVARSHVAVFACAGEVPATDDKLGAVEHEAHGIDRRLTIGRDGRDADETLGLEIVELLRHEHGYFLLRFTHRHCGSQSWSLKRLDERE